MSALKPIPASYFEPADKQGRIERITYMTKGQEKVAYVYLPYGYTDEKAYDILYCLHGGGGEIEIYFGTDEIPGMVTNTLDHMIEAGDIPPVIAVSPTYYGASRQHSLDSAVDCITSFCSDELTNDLIPAVEGKYHTYARTTDREGLVASRHHRAYTGYSMGSLSTWFTFFYQLDCFAYFMPMSGDCWTNGQSDAKKAQEWLDQACESRPKIGDDFVLYAVTGDKDIAYERMKRQIEVMEQESKYFHFSGEAGKENADFGVEPNATHDYRFMPLYFYNGLPRFWKIK